MGKSVLPMPKGMIGKIGTLLRRRVLSAAEELVPYSFDATPGLESRLPGAVVFPSSTEEVSAVLEFADREGLPVIPRGAGTNLAGGTVPTGAEVVICLTAMKRIIGLNEADLIVDVEAGVVTAAIDAEAARLGLFYPPDPGSVAVTTIGGNIAQNAGGLRGLKYGVTRDYVLGLEAVTATGDVVHAGGRTVKNATGYDLAGLLTGSEGTLAVITGATLRLLPRPADRRSLLATFGSISDAAAAVAGLISARVVPATLEIMDRQTIRAVEAHSHPGLPGDAEAVLLIEVDGPAAVVVSEAETVTGILEANRAMTVHRAADGAERDRIWLARRVALSALARTRPTLILEDATVPRSQVPDMVSALREIAARHELVMATFGHAGDGNLHPTILTDRRDAAEMSRVRGAVDEIFEAALRLGGTLSGEHGIGTAKKPYLEAAIGGASLAALRGIKAAFDPRGILNPGKLFDAVGEDGRP